MVRSRGEIDELLSLSHELGAERRNLAILGEGNISVDCGDGTFLIKASGSSLGDLRHDEVSPVSFERILPLLDRESVPEVEIEETLEGSVAHPGARKPSVETFLHAICLTEGGARWVGHTHSVAINRILCSSEGARPFERHVFPDAVVVCGPRPVVVPYVDPGFALGRAARRGLQTFREEYGTAPKLMLLENHGPVALGSTPKEVFNIMLMATKWAEILWGSYALGGPSFLPDEEVKRIDGRLDEVHRRRELLRERDA